MKQDFLLHKELLKEDDKTCYYWKGLKENYYACVKGEEELLEAENALKTCNFKLVSKINLDPSVNFVFLKTKSVDNKYPRNFGQIKKKPFGIRGFFNSPCRFFNSLLHIEITDFVVVKKLIGS